MLSLQLKINFASNTSFTAWTTKISNLGTMLSFLSISIDPAASQLVFFLISANFTSTLEILLSSISSTKVFMVFRVKLWDFTFFNNLRTSSPVIPNYAGSFVLPLLARSYGPSCWYGHFLPRRRALQPRPSSLTRHRCIGGSPLCTFPTMPPRV